MKKETELPFGNVEEKSNAEGLFDISKRLERSYTTPVMNFAPNRFISRVRIDNKFLLSRDSDIEVADDDPDRFLSYEQKQRKFVEKRAPVVLHVNKKRKKIVIAQMKQNTDVITKFLVERIAPFALSLDMATNEAQQMLNIITNDSGVVLDTAELMGMSQRIMIVITIQNLAKLLKLNKKWEERMINLYLEKSFERLGGGTKGLFERLLALAAKQKKPSAQNPGGQNESET